MGTIISICSVIEKLNWIDNNEEQERENELFLSILNDNNVVKKKRRSFNKHEIVWGKVHIHTIFTLDGNNEMATDTMIQDEKYSKCPILYCSRYHYHIAVVDVDATATATAAAVSCLLQCEIYYLDKYSNIVKLFPYLVSIFVITVVAFQFFSSNFRSVRSFVYFYSFFSFRWKQNA